MVITNTEYFCSVCRQPFSDIYQAKAHEDKPVSGIELELGTIFLLNPSGIACLSVDGDDCLHFDDDDYLHFAQVLSKKPFRLDHRIRYDFFAQRWDADRGLVSISGVHELERHDFTRHLGQSLGYNDMVHLEARLRSDTEYRKFLTTL